MNPKSTKNTKPNNTPAPDDPTADYDYLFKIVMVGDPGVGKSSILLRFADEMYSENYYATIGVDFRFKTLLMNNKSIKLQIWDTAGQEKFRSLTTAYYKGADAILLAFDLTNRHSFESLEEWLDQINEYTTTDPVVIMIGAKSDVHSGHNVNRQEIEEFANEKGFPYYLVSAKTNENVMECFVHVVTELIDRRTKPKEDNNILHLINNQEENPSWTNNCCNTK